MFENLEAQLRARGFNPMIAHVDPASILTKLNDRASIPIKTVGTGSHEADAEVEIKILKEILRSSEAGLPCPVPLRFIIYQMYGAVMFRNTLLRRGQSHSPRESYSGVKLDIKKTYKGPIFGLLPSI